MRLVDAEALVDKLKDWRGDKEDVDMNDPHDVGYYAAMSRAIRFASLAHTIDAVSVVRCKDCKHWGTDWAIGETEHVKCCEFANYMVGANGYCVYGEAKDNAAD